MGSEGVIQGWGALERGEDRGPGKGPRGLSHLREHGAQSWQDPGDGWVPRVGVKLCGPSGSSAQGPSLAPYRLRQVWLLGADTGKVGAAFASIAGGAEA